MTNRSIILAALVATCWLLQPAMAQVAIEVPQVVPGAPPVTVEHIKVHGSALEGNLEGIAVDRDVLRAVAVRFQDYVVPFFARNLRFD
jgi:hypothetical protein